MVVSCCSRTSKAAEPRLAACLHDPRQPGKITHPLDEILRFRMLAIVAGYPDGNDCDVLRDDPAFKMALDRPPVSGPALCSQPTVSRLENMPRRPELYRMAMLDLYCDSFPSVPSHLTLDLDESFDRVDGEQDLRKFNAYYDDWGFLPRLILGFGVLAEECAGCDHRVRWQIMAFFD